MTEEGQRRNRESPFFKTFSALGNKTLMVPEMLLSPYPVIPLTTTPQKPRDCEQRSSKQIILRGCMCLQEREISISLTR